MEPDYTASYEQPLKDHRRYVRRVCSYLGFALCILFIVLQGTGLILGLFASFLSAYAAGAYGEAAYAGMAASVSEFMFSDGFSMVGASLLSYGIAIPAMLLLLRRIPEVKAEPKRMRPGKFIMFLVLVMGGGYIFNFIGVMINGGLASVTQRSAEQLNPILDLMSEFNWGIAVYSSIIAPFFEELVFRKIILNRMRPLGEKAAVIYSAVLFGLLHGNIAQFLYATVIGLILGYIAVKTGRIFYCVLLHMIINGYAAIFLMGMLMLFKEQAILLSLLSLLVFLCLIAMMIGAVVLYFINRRRVTWKKGIEPEGIEYQDFSSAMFLNAGFISILAVCLGMIAFYAFWA